jgi:hypothetical protein
MDARSKLLDVAAFLDRVQRHGQAEDFRVVALRQAARLLQADDAGRARAVLLHLSDPSETPIPAAPMQGALGAWKPPA